MLAADKLQLQSALKQQATALKEKEFNLHHSNLSEFFFRVQTTQEIFQYGHAWSHTPFFSLSFSRLLFVCVWFVVTMTPATSIIVASHRH